MSMDDVISQCPTCGYPSLTNEHAADCPNNKTAAETSETKAAETKEIRIAAARRRLKEFADRTKEEVEESISSGKIKNSLEHRADSSEIDEAVEIIEDLLAAQDLPKVTVAREHLKTILAEGLKERPTAYQKGVAAIIGTVGREPLLPDGEDRVILELALKPGEIVPRFTGPAKVFEGVIGVRGTKVSPEKIRVIDPGSPSAGETGASGAKAA